MNALTCLIALLGLIGFEGMLLWQDRREFRKMANGLASSAPATICVLSFLNILIATVFLTSFAIGFHPFITTAVVAASLALLGLLIRTCRNRREKLHGCQPMPKLSFPTLGMTGAGKTSWLAMAYRELNNGNAPEGVRFERLETESAQEMDEIVDPIINDHIDAEPNLESRLPFSLVYKLRDRDPWGTSRVLVNVLDMFGSHAHHSDLHDPQCQRALLAEGYIVVLDPSKGPDEQRLALEKFREHVELVRGAGKDAELRLPVAICVTKLDLLRQTFGSPEGGDEIEHFYEKLRTIDPTGAEMSLSVIRRRSELTAQLREAIWPNWNIERQLEQSFGGCYQFFPMAPFGLDDLEAGSIEKKTTLGHPFGVLEPLLWLLHMNGYRVLETE